MNTVNVRGVIIGEGIPKICVPLTSKSKAELLVDAEAIATEMGSGGGVSGGVIDLIEWRADHYEELNNIKELNNFMHMRDVLSDLRRVICDKPLIFTYRTTKEGGAGSMRDERLYYATCLKTAIDSGFVDVIDVELFMGDEILLQLIAYAHTKGVKVIASNHDFGGTPNLEELVERLKRMQALGADILKIAVMPSNKKDVLTLLEATVIMSEQYADRPLVTIAMSDLGAISRVTGEVFGSSITFGILGKLSAPGQIAASELSEMLNRVHHIFPNENKL